METFTTWATIAALSIAIIVTIRDFLIANLENKKNFKSTFSDIKELIDRFKRSHRKTPKEDDILEDK